MLTAIQSVLAIILVVSFGFFAGKKNIIKKELSSSLSSLVMLFTFPASLFVSMANTNINSLFDLNFLFIFLLALLLPFFIIILIGKKCFSLSVPQAIMFSFASTFPNMAFMGIPYLTEELGSSSLISVAIGNVITSVFVIPIVIFFLESNTQSVSSKSTNFFFKALLTAFKKPLVLAPALGLVFVLFQIKLPHFLIEGLTILGSATSPIALFALGLMMTKFQFKLSLRTCYIMLIKLLLQPLFAICLIFFFKLKGLHAQEIIMLISMPTAVIVSMFAEKYNCLKEETISAIIGGSILSVITLVFFTVWATSF